MYSWSGADRQIRLLQVSTETSCVAQVLNSEMQRLTAAHILQEVTAPFQRSEIISSPIVPLPNKAICMLDSALAQDCKHEAQFSFIWPVMANFGQVITAP